MTHNDNMITIPGQTSDIRLNFKNIDGVFIIKQIYHQSKSKSKDIINTTYYRIIIVYNGSKTAIYIKFDDLDKIINILDNKKNFLKVTHNITNTRHGSNVSIKVDTELLHGYIKNNNFVSDTSDDIILISKQYNASFIHELIPYNI